MHQELAPLAAADTDRRARLDHRADALRAVVRTFTTLCFRRSSRRDPVLVLPAAGSRARETPEVRRLQPANATMVEVCCI